MAQWDVHQNPAAQARQNIPYLVVVQSDLLDQLPTRLVMPLSRTSAALAGMPSRLAPVFDVCGEVVRLKAHEAGILPVRVLGVPVASLRAQSQRIVDALDAVINGV